MRDQLKHLLRGCPYNAMVNLNFFMILIRDNLMSVLRTQIKRLELRNLTVHGDDELETNSPSLIIVLSALQLYRSVSKWGNQLVYCETNRLSFNPNVAQGFLKLILNIFGRAFVENDQLGFSS